MIKPAAERFTQSCQANAKSKFFIELGNAMVEVVEAEIDKAVAVGKFMVEIEPEHLCAASWKIEERTGEEMYVNTSTDRAQVFLSLGKRYEEQGFDFEFLRGSDMSSGVRIRWEQ